MVKIELATVNLVAILGLTLIVIVALVMKEANVASMAVGGIAGFIGHRIAAKEAQTGTEETQVLETIVEPAPEIAQGPTSEQAPAQSPDIGPEDTA